MRIANRSLSLIAFGLLSSLMSGAVCLQQPAPRPITPSLQVAADLNPIIVAAGGTAELRAHVTGGVAPYTFQWTLSGGPQATIMTATAQTSDVQFPSSGQYRFIVTVTDDVGTQASSFPVVTTVP